MQGPLKGVVTSSLLQYHIVPNVNIIIAKDENSGSNNFETISGYTVTVVKSDGTFSVNGIPVITADLIGTNGVVHLIDSVIVPSQQSVG